MLGEIVDEALAQLRILGKFVLEGEVDVERLADAQVGEHVVDARRNGESFAEENDLIQSALHGLEVLLGVVGGVEGRGQGVFDLRPCQFDGGHLIGAPVEFGGIADEDFFNGSELFCDFVVDAMDENIAQDSLDGVFSLRGGDLDRTLPDSA